MGKDKKPLERNLTTEDIGTLLAFLDVEVKDMQVVNLVRVLDSTNFTPEFLLEVVKEEIRIQQNIIRTELELMVQEARQEDEKRETLQ